MAVVSLSLEIYITQLFYVMYTQLLCQEVFSVSSQSQVIDSVTGSVLSGIYLNEKYPNSSSVYP